jgi:two-component system cell cycle sensor histidine kinase/response regulator CckA
MSEPHFSELRLPLSERLPIVTYTNLFRPLAETVWMSSHVSKVTGYSVEDFLRRPGFIETIIHTADRSEVLEEMQASRDQLRAFSRDYRLLTRDGRTIWIHDESVPIVGEDGSAELIQGYFIDITSRKELEHQLLHLQRVEALGRIAGEIAHDFNNHLTAIRGHADLLDRSLPESAPERRHTAEIRTTSDRAATLTSQLLAYVRRDPLASERLDLADVVTGVRAMLGRLVGVDVVIRYEAGAPAAVRIDRCRLEQVIVNLVTNARAAMPGGGTLTIRTLNVAVDGAAAERLRIPRGDYAALVVSDTGVGMDEATRSSMFTPYFTTKSRAEGSGLGLSIVERIVRDARGGIDVDSGVGRGTTIRVLLPAARPD